MEKGEGRCEGTEKGKRKEGEENVGGIDEGGGGLPKERGLIRQGGRGGYEGKCVLGGRRRYR